MLSKSAARKFFLTGTFLCSGAFVLLTIDTIQRIPEQTHQQNLSESAIRGKHIWETNNCMGCHTLMGEGAYYGPELTKVYERRGPDFIKAMLKDPQSMYPGQRKMQKYNLNDQQIDDTVAFLKWVGEMDLNGFPAKPDLVPAAAAATTRSALVSAGAPATERPQVFNQMCTACHSLEGKGGNVGPALDDVGARRNKDYITSWLKDPIAIKADSKMPKLPLSDGDINALAHYLSQMKGTVKQ